MVQRLPGADGGVPAAVSLARVSPRTVAREVLRLDGPGDDGDVAVECRRGRVPVRPGDAPAGSARGRASCMVRARAHARPPAGVDAGRPVWLVPADEARSDPARQGGPRVRRG